MLARPHPISGRFALRLAGLELVIRVAVRPDAKLSAVERSILHGQAHTACRDVRQHAGPVAGRVEHPLSRALRVLDPDFQVRPGELDVPDVIVTGRHTRDQFGSHIGSDEIPEPSAKML